MHKSANCVHASSRPAASRVCRPLSVLLVGTHRRPSPEPVGLWKIRALKVLLRGNSELVSLERSRLSAACGLAI